MEKENKISIETMTGVGKKKNSRKRIFNITS